MSIDFAIPAASRAFPSTTDQKPTDVTFAGVPLTGSGSPASTNAAAPGPTLLPPGVQGRQDATAADQTCDQETIEGQKVTALWSNSANLNSWFYLATAGWKRADPSTASGCHNLTVLAASARQTGAAPQINHDASGIVTSMYVW